MTENKSGRVTFQNLYHTREFKKRFISSMSSAISHAVICSPFFDKLPSPFGDVVGFCKFLNVRGTNSIHIITRPPSSDPQAMTRDVAKLLAAQGVEIFIRATPYLHAKLYHFEYEQGTFRTFVGSANFTLGGFERNHELVTEMEGFGKSSPCHTEIARMSQIGALTYNAWVARGQPEGDKGQK
jgi:hypothetical protein